MIASLRHDSAALVQHVVHVADAKPPAAPVQQMLSDTTNKIAGSNQEKTPLVDAAPPVLSEEMQLASSRIAQRAEQLMRQVRQKSLTPPIKDDQQHERIYYIMLAMCLLEPHLFHVAVSANYLEKQMTFVNAQFLMNQKKPPVKKAGAVAQAATHFHVPNIGAVPVAKLHAFIQFMSVALSLGPLPVKEEAVAAAASTLHLQCPHDGPLLLLWQLTPPLRDAVRRSRRPQALPLTLQSLLHRSSPPSVPRSSNRIY